MGRKTREESQSGIDMGEGGRGRDKYQNTDQADPEDDGYDTASDYGRRNDLRQEEVIFCRDHSWMTGLDHGSGVAH